MAHFSRTGSMHGAQGADYSQGPQHGNHQHVPPPRNNFGLRGKIAELIQKRADQMAERHVDYVFGMQEQLEQQRDYRDTGTYRGAAQMDHVSPQIAQMFHGLHERIASLERDLTKALEAICGSLGGNGSAYAPSEAGSSASRPHRAEEREHDPMEPRIVELDDHDDVSDAPAYRPVLPPRTQDRPDAAAGTARPRQLPPRNPPPLPSRAAPRREFPPPPLHPSQSGAAERAARNAASRSGIDIEQWRTHAATSTVSEADDAASEITSGTSQRVPAHAPHRIARRPVPAPPQPNAANDNRQLNEHMARQAAQSLEANAQEEARLSEAGRDTASRITR